MKSEPIFYKKRKALISVDAPPRGKHKGFCASMVTERIETICALDFRACSNLACHMCYEVDHGTWRLTRFAPILFGAASLGDVGQIRDYLEKQRHLRGWVYEVSIIRAPDIDTRKILEKLQALGITNLEGDRFYD